MGDDDESDVSSSPTPTSSAPTPPAITSQEYALLPWYTKFFLYCKSAVLGWTEWKEHGLFGKIIEVSVFPFTVLRVMTMPIIDIDKGGNDWLRITTNCLTTPIAAFFLFGQVKDSSEKILGLSKWIFLILVGVAILPLGLVMNIARVRRFLLVKIVFAVWVFGMAVVWMNAFGTELVDVLQTLCFYTNLDESIAAATFLSWGGSVGDLVADVSIVLSNRPLSGVTACYASPMYNALVNLAIASGVYYIAARSVKPVHIVRSLATLFVSISIIACSTVMFVFGVVMNGHIRRWTGGVVFGVYVVCLVVIVIVQIGIFKIKGW